MPRRTVVLILLIASLSPVGMTIAIPALAIIARDLDAGPAAVQFVVSGFLLGLGIGQLFCGPLADRFGRRPVLISGLLLFVLGSLVCANATAVETLLGGRLLQAFGAATSGAISKALVSDLFRGADTARVMSYVTATLETSMILAAPVGGRLGEHLSWQSIFWVSSAYAGVILLAVLFLLPESRPADAPRVLSPALVLRSYRSLCRSPPFIGNVLLISLIAGAGIAYFSVMPLALAEHAGHSADTIGDLLMLNGLALIAGALLAGRLVARVGLDRAQLLFMVGILATTVAFPLTVVTLPVTVLTLMVPLMLISLFRTGIASLALPQAIGAVPAITATAAGLVGVFSTILAGVISALGATLYQHSLLYFAVMVLACAVLAALCHALVATRKAPAKNMEAGR